MYKLCLLDSVWYVCVVCRVYAFAWYVGYVCVCVWCVGCVYACDVWSLVRGGVICRLSVCVCRQEVAVELMLPTAYVKVGISHFNSELDSPALWLVLFLA